MKYFAHTSFLALALVGCAGTATKNEAPGPSASNTGLAPQQARITDSAIRNDQSQFGQLQRRLRKLNESGVTQGSYALAKAQCWLDTARNQHDENDRTGYVEEALAESQKITQALEVDRNALAGNDTPLIARSSKLRDDLWVQLGNLKAKPESMVCIAATVACAEVRLVRAGHADQQTGWRQATPHVQMVEDALRRAAVQAAQCKPAPVAAAAAAPLVAPASPAVLAPPVPPAPAKETFVILSDALFKFGKSGRDDLLPSGSQRLGDIANRLKAYAGIDSLSVVGHTDRLGGTTNNDKLSQLRANTVKEFFVSRGIKASVASAQGKGEREPLTGDQCGKRLSKAQLIDCLQPDRRVTIEVKGLAK
jgi:OmpA-OmpF porin, OOP family